MSDRVPDTTPWMRHVHDHTTAPVAVKVPAPAAGNAAAAVQDAAPSALTASPTTAAPTAPAAPQAPLPVLPLLPAPPALPASPAPVAPPTQAVLPTLPAPAVPPAPIAPMVKVPAAAREPALPAAEDTTQAANRTKLRCLLQLGTSFQLVSGLYALHKSHVRELRVRFRVIKDMYTAIEAADVQRRAELRDALKLIKITLKQHDKTRDALKKLRHLNRTVRHEIGHGDHHEVHHEVHNDNRNDARNKVTQ